MQITTNNLGGALRTAGLASLKGSPEQCIAKEPSEVHQEFLVMVLWRCTALDCLSEKQVQQYAVLRQDY